jgi:hypothetical protein
MIVDPEYRTRRISFIRIAAGAGNSAREGEGHGQQHEGRQAEEGDHLDR